MFYNIDNVDIYVSDVNPGGTETVLFVHGWPLSGRMFEYQVNTLASAGIRCVTFDLPGYGLSDKPYNGYSYAQMTEMIHELISKMGLKNVTLAGFSMGGAIAAKYASKYGAQRIKKLILIGAACPSFIQRSGYPFGMERFQVDSLIRDVETDKPAAFGDFSMLVFESPVSNAFLGWFAGITDQAAMLSARKSLEALRDEDLREDIKKINMPVLICHGINDRVCPFAFAEETQKLIRNARLTRFENSGHDIFYAEKDKLNTEIALFVNQTNIVSVSSEHRHGEEFDTMTYKFENLSLPYHYDALEPDIDTKTMEIHHDRHLQTYINNLNVAIQSYPAYQNWTLTKLLANLRAIPQPLQTQIQKNAGGAFNHFFYFDGMTDDYKAPSPAVSQWIEAGFGSVDAFLKTFKDAALSVFGSGYAWLVLNKKGSAAIVTTPNQDCPVSDGIYPLLNIDVWEHAYYLLHYNDRSAYIDDFFKVINWDMVESRWKSAGVKQSI